MGQLFEHIQGDFGGIFFGVVDELPIVPEASGNVATSDSDST